MRRNAGKFRTAYLVLPALVAATLLLSALSQRRALREDAVPEGGMSPMAPAPHVTRSLAELGKMDELNAHVLFFNGVPKCGAEVAVLLLQWLQGWNGFRHVRVRGSAKRRLTRLEQEQLVYETYDRVKKEAVPVSFDRHVHFVNFTSFDRQSPTFINLIRNPVDKVVSRFTFEYAKRYLPRKQNDVNEKYVTAAFKRCLEKKHRGCHFEHGGEYDLIIPYFCGQQQRCRLLNDEWALKTAKSNIERYFPVVGVLEDVNTTLKVFEHRIPYFFRGAQTLYYRDILEPFRQTPRRQIEVSEEIKNYLKSMLIKEMELYEWVKSRLYQQLKTINDNANH